MQFLFRHPMLPTAVAAVAILSAGRAWPAEYDVVLRGGTIYDGSGKPPFVGDVALRGDLIAAVGDLSADRGKTEIRAAGLAVAPGFINMMCWANETLIVDGRSQSDIRQGVTLEVMGEGDSMGPLNDRMKKQMLKRQSDIRYPIAWTTLGEYLQMLQRRGVSANVASFIGAATPRNYVIGQDNRPPTADELKRMQDLVRQAMREGAMGVASALIYPPGSFAKTDEIIALSKAAAEYDGLYASHMRSEGAEIIEGVQELLTIAREAKIRAEIYHLKTAGRENWPKMDAGDRDGREGPLRGAAHHRRHLHLPGRLDRTGFHHAAVGGGRRVRGLLATLEGSGHAQRIAAEMRVSSPDWENMFLEPGSPAGILLVGFKSKKLKPLTGKNLAEIAKMRGKSPEETVMDLIVEDESPIATIYFTQSDEHLRRKVALPWCSFCSDSESLAPEGVFLKSNVHPRAYGSFARLLAKYVRDEKLITLQEAIRKLTALPAENLRLDRRGRLKENYFADVVVFDPAKIQDHATYEKPHQYATGMVHVFVNGVQVLKDGDHTGAKPGRFVRGPGWKR